MAEDLEDRIRRRAHRIWERDGCPEGRHADQGEEFQIPGHGDRSPWPETDADRARDTGATGTVPAPAPDPARAESGSPASRTRRNKVAG